MLVQKEQATFNVYSSYEKEDFCYNVRFKMIEDDFVCIMSLYISFTVYDFLGVIANLMC